MAKHVKFTLTSHPLSREENGITFNVEENGGKLGELVVSKGGLRWKAKGQQKDHFCSWKKFDGLMQDIPKK